MNKIQNKLIGNRIKSARMQLGYSRREFAEKFNFSSATIQAWEDGKYVVPVKNLSKFIEALYEAGLVSTLEWFTKGVGLPPCPKDIFPLRSGAHRSLEVNEDLFIEENPIHREINFFEQLNDNSMVITVPDDTMLPFFNIGDYVGGNTVSGRHADDYIGSFCIITLDSGETFIRKLKFGSKKGYYNLVSTNLDTNINTAFIMNCRIKRVAQVVWHRKTA